MNLYSCQKNYAGKKLKKSTRKNKHTLVLIAS